MTVQLTGKQALQGVYIALLVVIIGLLLWSKPWANTTGETRKITVTGSATVQAEPDEYTFSPYFEVKGDDQETVKEEVSKLANDAVAALKDLGVEEKDIKLDASSYDRWYLDDDDQGVLNAYLQISVRDKDLAQKVQDYLTSSEAKGQLTSYETFSESKQKELDAQATEKAIEDARSKAEAQAKLFGASLGDVIEVNQNDGLSVMPYSGGAMGIAELDASASSLPVLPGEQDVTKTVYVVYELK